MSRTPRINPAIAAMDDEITMARDVLASLHRKVNEQAAIVTALESARGRIAETGAPTRVPRAAKPWKPRGPVEKAIMHHIPLGTGVGVTAEQLRTATGAAPASLRSALARMVEAKALTVEGDRYSLAGGEIKDAAE